jgi:CyaY protein
VPRFDHCRFRGQHCLQTPVRQIWAAFRDRAWHFDLDARGQWLDDRGQGINLFTLVQDLAREHAGVTITIGK